MHSVFSFPSSGVSLLSVLNKFNISGYELIALFCSQSHFFCLIFLCIVVRQLSNCVPCKNRGLASRIFNNNAQIDNKVYSPQWFSLSWLYLLSQNFQGVNGLTYHKTFLLSKYFFIFTVNFKLEALTEENDKKKKATKK